MRQVWHPALCSSCTAYCRQLPPPMRCNIFRLSGCTAPGQLAAEAALAILKCRRLHGVPELHVSAKSACGQRQPLPAMQFKHHERGWLGAVPPVPHRSGRRQQSGVHQACRHTGRQPTGVSGSGKALNTVGTYIHIFTKICIILYIYYM